MKVPHPFPYQGSKRIIAPEILKFFPDDVELLIEPFCGASAISIASAAFSLAKKYHLNDINTPLMKLWEMLLSNPEELSNKYEKLWNDQVHDKKAFFLKIRREFNTSHKPEHLLYLLARIVKGAVRYSSNGEFNQSADNRRSGMRPNAMRHQLLGVSTLLARKTTISSSDYKDLLCNINQKDLVYMDPPYQGTSFTRDHRYLNGLCVNEFIDWLKLLNRQNVSYIISYDGKTGTKEYGQRLPDQLNLKHYYIHAGRSSQATLLGRSDETFESLYISPALNQRLGNSINTRFQKPEQHVLAF